MFLMKHSIYNYKHVMLKFENIHVPDVIGMFTLCNSHHPQELVDVIAGVTNHSAKYNLKCVFYFTRFETKNKANKMLRF